MKLRKIYDRVCAEFKQLDLAITRETQTEITISGDINVKPYDDGIELKIIADKDGFTEVNFAFDKLEKTLANYNLVNDFNSFMHGNCSAYINDKGYFIIAVINKDCYSDKDAANKIINSLYLLTNESVTNKLLPITKVTTE